MFPVQVDTLKKRKMVSMVSVAAGHWRAAEGGESPQAKLRAGSEVGERPDGRWTPALSPASSPFSGPCPFCWLSPQWLCPGRGHGDWQVQLRWAFGEDISASSGNCPLTTTHLPTAPKPTENVN